jgi:hypothetical protein
MGYFVKRQYQTLIRMAIALFESKDESLEWANGLDRTALDAIIVDWLRVSFMISTEHPISAFFASITDDLESFKKDFLKFVDAMAIENNSEAFGQLAVMAIEFEKTGEYKAPTPPTDPNL